jgi:hypothetical protein
MKNGIISAEFNVKIDIIVTSPRPQPVTTWKRLTPIGVYNF